MSSSGSTFPFTCTISLSSKHRTTCLPHMALSH
jgi:hypothetical protein